MASVITNSANVGQTWSRSSATDQFLRTYSFSALNLERCIMGCEVRAIYSIACGDIAIFGNKQTIGHFVDFDFRLASHWKIALAGAVLIETIPYLVSWHEHFQHFHKQISFAFAWFKRMTGSCRLHKLRKLFEFNRNICFFSKQVMSYRSESLSHCIRMLSWISGSTKNVLQLNVTEFLRKMHVWLVRREGKKVRKLMWLVRRTTHISDWVFQSICT